MEIKIQVIRDKNTFSNPTLHSHPLPSDERPVRVDDLPLTVAARKHLAAVPGRPVRHGPIPVHPGGQKTIYQPACQVLRQVPQLVVDFRHVVLAHVHQHGIDCMISQTLRAPDKTSSFQPPSAHVGGLCELRSGDLSRRDFLSIESRFC